MTLYCMTNRVGTLLFRYNNMRKRLGLIFSNYTGYKSHAGMECYTYNRIRIFQSGHKLPDIFSFYKIANPGDRIRQQRWQDPRVEWGMRNPRSRRKRK